MKIFGAAFLVATALSLAGCATASMPDLSSSYGARSAKGNQAVGSALLEAMAGGLVGGSIGSNLDNRDRRSGLEAEYRALEYTPSGQPVTWRNARSTRYGEVVAAQPYRVGSQDCRQYNHTVYIDGKSSTARGTACRNQNGSWTPLI